MFRNSFLFIFILVGLSGIRLYGQESIMVSGQLYDSVQRKGIEHSVIMAVRIRDSVLTKFIRSDWEGKFTMNLPLDTFQLLVTHPKFEERSFYLFGNGSTKDVNLGRILMYDKGKELKEFVVIANSEPIYFRGDTLVMVADSFKTAANANVEDLFKRLPGFQVDKTGKIMVHGKEVSKVYVDGDEFFGTDPTIATKNLPAGAIQTVEVFEKKIDGNTTDETEKVINLTLKKSAKKGYFGKINGATDGSKFYEGEVLLNRFQGNQKISVFGLVSNTPRNSFNWQDRQQYGLTEEMGRFDNDGNYSFEPRIGNLGTGLPQRYKTGFYYTDKWGKKVEFGANFTYTHAQVISQSEANTSYLFTDTTYSGYDVETSVKKQESYAFNMTIKWQIDSLTKLEIQPRVRQINEDKKDVSTNDYYTEERFLSRTTDNQFQEKTGFTESSIAARINRNFRKKYRNALFSYQLKHQTSNVQDLLINTDINRFSNQTLLATNQQKTGVSQSIQHLGEVKFTEPLSPKLTLELNYIFQFSNGSNEKLAFDYDGENYANYNNLFSNSFENTTLNQRAGSRLIYKLAKHDFIGGVSWNSVLLNSINVLANQRIEKTSENWLPYFSYKWKMSKSKNLTFIFNTKVNNPSITQLQPLPNNQSLNNIYIGNINLVSELERNFRLNFFTYKATTGSHTYANGSISLYENAFSQSLTYDSQGRAITQTINMPGNQNANVNIGTALPFFKQKIRFTPNANYTYRNMQTLVNLVQTQTINHSPNVGGRLELLLDSLEIGVSSNYGYTFAQNSLRMDLQRFSTQSYSVFFKALLPYKMEITSSVEYVLNTQRAEGFNLNYVLWDASFSRKFLNKESLILSIEANDLLNQNISNNRSVFNNIIVDRKTNIIGRYVLVRVVYKFNVLKSNPQDDLY
jgi:hypothetical protein